MSGDYTKRTSTPRKRFAAVLMQQGRVQLDSDWNEQGDILRERGAAALTRHVRSGGRALPHHARRLQARPDRRAAAQSLDRAGPALCGRTARRAVRRRGGHLFVPALPSRSARPAGRRFASPISTSGSARSPPSEDRDLLDVALGGVDTTARLQTVWQLRVAGVDQAVCGMPVGEMPSAGRLTAQAIAPPAPDDPCILPPIAGLSRAGEPALPDRGPQRRAARDGALQMVARQWQPRRAGQRPRGLRHANHLDRSAPRPATKSCGFAIGDWVTVTDDHRELHGEPGEMAQIADINEADRRIVLDRSLPTGSNRGLRRRPRRARRAPYPHPALGPDRRAQPARRGWAPEHRGRAGADRGGHPDQFHDGSGRRRFPGRRLLVILGAHGDRRDRGAERRPAEGHRASLCSARGDLRARRPRPGDRGLPSEGRGRGLLHLRRPPGRKHPGRDRRTSRCRRLRLPQGGPAPRR